MCNDASGTGAGVDGDMKVKIGGIPQDAVVKYGSDVASPGGGLDTGQQGSYATGSYAPGAAAPAGMPSVNGAGAAAPAAAAARAPVGVAVGPSQGGRFVRPNAELRAPSFLQLPGAMTPLQARSMIATYGASGVGSKWRDPMAVAYYKNLVQRQLIGPDGSPIGTVLPVEREYLGALLGGQDVGPETADFLSALEGL